MSCSLMPNDKDPFNIDLTFLDEKPRQEVPPAVDTAYKYNWKNIAIIAAIILGIGTIILVNNNSPPQPTTWSPPVITPNVRSPASSGNDTVAVGQYRCSRYNSNRADQLRPMNSPELDAEQRALQRRSDALASLQLKIESDPVSQYSPQSAIDQNNEMIDQYNLLLRSYRSNSSRLQMKINQFNARVEAYNAYLLAHCTKSGR